MTPLDYDPAYSAGVRALLVDAAAAPRPRRRFPWTIGLGLAALSVLGAGGALAASHLLPGQDLVVALGDSHTIDGTGPARLVLALAPAGTNSLDFGIACVTPGRIVFPDGSSMTCDASDASDRVVDVTATNPWSPGSRSLRLRADAGMRWRLTYRFSDHRPTGLLTNARGQTYGVDGAERHPDLVAVVATNGKEGYLDVQEAARLDGSDPSHFHTPEQAVEWLRHHPDYEVDVPVYRSDGLTRIGVFRIGG